jgi:hypothetical protein
MRKNLPASVKLAVLLTLMPLCGLVVLVVVVFFFMHLGLYLEDNYELLFGGGIGIVIVVAAFSIGAVIPLLLLWQWLGDE